MPGKRPAFAAARSTLSKGTLLNNFALVFGILGALGLGAMSPGPSFLLVARTAVTVSRRDGVAAALGMGVGGALFAVIALLGLHVLLSSVPWLHLLLKVAGGAYLVWLGYGIWRGAAHPLATPAFSAEQRTDQAQDRTHDRATRSGHAFWLGTVTQLSNPKTAIVYASVFSAFLPAAFSLTLGVVLTVMVFVVEAGWYGIVAIALSSAAPRACYLRYKKWVDRAAGAVMAALGIKLMLDARTL